jgi:hypothetical protein
MKYLPKILKLVPILIDLYSDVSERVEAARRADSDGGSRVTPLEIAKIVVAEIGPLVEAIAASLAPAPA